MCRCNKKICRIENWVSEEDGASGDFVCKEVKHVNVSYVDYNFL